MNVRQSVLGEVAERSSRTISGIDVGVLVRRLILFDRVIIKSFILREIPFLIQTFGQAGFATLVRTGILRFNCGITAVIVDLKRNGVRHLPLDHFSFATLQLAELEKKLRSELRFLQGITGLKNPERAALEEAIWDSVLWEPAPYRQGLLDQVDRDFRNNTPALQAALHKKLQADLGRPTLRCADVPIRIQETSHRIFRVENSLTKSFGFTPEKTHLALQAAVMAVANLNTRLADIQAYSAITGFVDEEAPILFGKLAGIIAPMNPDLAESQFERVIELAEVPDLKPGQRVDVEQLMKVRDSAECREFREWLGNLENVTDAEVKEMVASIKSKISLLAGSTGGKFVRLATTTGIGLIPGVGLAAGIVAGTIDSFLVDRVLPRSGVVAFLTETYPSLFVSP